MSSTVVFMLSLRAQYRTKISNENSNGNPTETRTETILKGKLQKNIIITMESHTLDAKSTPPKAGSLVFEDLLSRKNK